MTEDTVVSHPSEDLDILNIKYLSDENRDNQCLIYCISMVLDYMASNYPNRWVRENIDPMPPEEVVEYFDIGERGWVPNERALNRLAEDSGPIHFEHTLNDYRPTDETFKMILRNNFNNSLPVIPIINIRMLRRSRTGGVHAVVAMGMADEEIAFHDPWGYPGDLKDAEEFIKAWDDVLNQVITISVGGQQPLNNRGDSQ